MELSLIGGANRGRSSNISPEASYNWFYEKNAGGDSLVPVPGARLFASTGLSEARGCINYNDKAFFVVGNTLFEIDSNGGLASRGTLNTGSGPVSMAHNGTRAGANQQIMIVDGTSGYIYDNTTKTMAEITDIDFTASQSVVFLDGYFIFAQKDSDRFWLTGLYDGSTIDPADFSTAEGHPDEIQSLLASEQEIVDAMFIIWQRMKIVMEPKSGTTRATQTIRFSAFKAASHRSAVQRLFRLRALITRLSG